VTLLDMSASGPVLATRLSAHTDHDWQVYFDINEMILRETKEAG
jgi:small conductance mechanosensitive channel